MNGNDLAKVSSCIYRVRPQLIRLGTLIQSAWFIQARRRSGRCWYNCCVNGVQLAYREKSMAERHCAWLNDPKGTEPEWGADAISMESPAEAQEAGQPKSECRSQTGHAPQANPSGEDSSASCVAGRGNARGDSVDQSTGRA